MKEGLVVMVMKCGECACADDTSSLSSHGSDD